MEPLKDRMRRVLGRGIAATLQRRSQPMPAIDGVLLVIAPHPDDETLGCGGLIARQARAGRRVHVLFLTDGEASHDGHPALSPTTLAAQRREEALAALAALGVPNPRSVATFLGAPDGGLDTLADEDRRALVSVVENWIRADRPEVICTPFLGGGSSDHDAATAVVEDALGAGGRVFEYPIWAWRNAVRLRGRLTQPEHNFRLELGPLHDVKQRAIACHRTQFEPVSPWRKPVMPAWLPAACGGPVEFYLRREIAPRGPRIEETGE